MSDPLTPKLPSRPTEPKVLVAFALLAALSHAPLARSEAAVSGPGGLAGAGEQPGTAGSAATLSVAAPGLPGPVAVRVLLPPSYASAPGRRYPVLYFLHDGSGDELALERHGVAADLTARMLAGTLPEMLVVSPRGKGTWFANSWDGRVPYADFLDRTLVPWVDGGFRTVAAREGRLAAGISMGGYGVLRWGLENPGLFSAVAGVSAAAQQMTWRGVREPPFFLRPGLDAVFGEDARTNVYAGRDLYQMLLSRPSLADGAPEVLLRCGTADRYRLDTVATFLSKFLATMGLRSEALLEPGGHDWGYWERSFPAAVADLARRLPAAAGGGRG